MPTCHNSQNIHTHTHTHTHRANLVLVKLEAKDIDKGGGLTRVVLKEGKKEVSLIQVTFKCLKDNVQYTVWIK